MKKTDKLKRYITNKKETKGITLIALVITIIILLILAGISIAMLTGENGILKKAQESKNTTVYKSDIENIKLAFHNENVRRQNSRRFRTAYSRIY